MSDINPVIGVIYGICAVIWFSLTIFQASEGNTGLALLNGLVFVLYAGLAVFWLAQS